MPFVNVNSLSPSLYKELVSFLSPHMINARMRRHYLDLSLGTGSSVEKKLDFSGSAKLFTDEVIRELVSCGSDDSGEIALVRFVREIQAEAGEEEKQILGTLISQIQEQLYSRRLALELIKGL